MTGSSVRAALSAGVKHVCFSKTLLDVFLKFLDFRKGVFLFQANFCGSVFSYTPKMALTLSAQPCFAQSLLPAVRSFSSQEVTKNLRLMTPEDVKPKVP